MLDVEVIDDPAAATVALEPVRSRLLAELAEPASAAALAARLGIARQKVNYHLRALEAHGLVRVAEKRRWGGLTERLLVATRGLLRRLAERAGTGRRRSGPRRRPALGQLPDRPGRPHRARGGRRSLRRSTEIGKRLATLSIDTEIRFRSAAERAAFSRELTEAVTTLAARYHDESAPGGRAHRLVVVAHPLPHSTPLPRSHHEREERCVRTPLGPGRGRSPRHARRRSGRPSPPGPGISSWFVPTEVEEREGGTVVVRLRPGHGIGRDVTAWEPPHRFVAESQDLGPDAPAGGHGVDRRGALGRHLRRARGPQPGSRAPTTGTTSRGRRRSAGPGSSASCGSYLTHFRGQPCAAFHVMGAAPEPEGRRPGRADRRARPGRRRDGPAREHDRAAPRRWPGPWPGPGVGSVTTRSSSGWRSRLPESPRSSPCRWAGRFSW